MINFNKFYKQIEFNVDYEVYEQIYVKQNDTKSRGFYVQIVQNGAVVHPSEYAMLTLFGLKPDGTQIFVDAVIEGDFYRIDLPNQALTVSGNMRAELALRGSDNEVITKDIVITINPSLSLEGVESTNEFTALQQALAEVANFAGDIQDVRLYADAILLTLGDLEDLTTEQKSSLVDSINEVKSMIDTINGDGSILDVLNEKVDKITLGDMAILETEEKEVLVNAINELKSMIDNINNESDVDFLIPLILTKADKSEVGDINEVDLINGVKPTSVTMALNSILIAFNELEETISNSLQDDFATKADVGELLFLETEDKSSIVAAVNEVKLAISQIEQLSNINEIITLLGSKANKTDIGELRNLTTTAKNNLVAAINEVKSSVEQIELTPGPPGPPGGDGPKGDPGADGTDATVTEESITNALGYKPADEAVIGNIESILDYILGE